MVSPANLKPCNEPPGIPKNGKAHKDPKICMEELIEYLIKQNDIIERQLLQEKDLKKKIKTDSAQLKSQTASFSQVLNTDHQESNVSDLRKVNAHFEKAKNDLATVLNGLFGEKSKIDFISTMNPLLEAFANNLECEEARYVEISAHSLKLKPIMILIDKNIIIRHPSNERMYALNVKDCS